MINQIVIRGFKRFAELTFDLPGHVVLAGPNNMGKTTILQAISAWALALNRWKQLNNFQRRGGSYARAPVTRQVFSAVPLRAFDLLWNKRKCNAGPIEITLRDSSGWKVTLEFIPDSTEQIYVRPKPDAEPELLRTVKLDAVFVPAMTGLSTEEPVYQPAKIQQLLGMSKPGEVLRNLLVEAHHSEEAWRNLNTAIRKMFDYELLPPDSNGADILAEYKMPGAETRYDIASAGSGFLQVLMLLTFLNVRQASVLLLDEPDAHLHIILQDAIYGELRAAAAKQNSQLIIATHSEVMINTVEPRELYLVLQTPRQLADTVDRARLIKSLSALTNSDIMLAMDAPGVLYTEDYTDLDILRAWANVLNHPIAAFLASQVFWKQTVIQPREGASGIQCRDHYESLRLVQDTLPGLMLVDGDANPGLQSSEITGNGLQRLRWKRYEIESYLVHPQALVRFVEKQVGSGSAEHVADLLKHFEETYPPAFVRDPLQDNPMLVGTKARTDLIPPALAAAGLHGFPYTRYHEIAAVMLKEEIHPEVIEKLDAIKKAFNLP